MSVGMTILDFLASLHKPRKPCEAIPSTHQLYKIHQYVPPSVILWMSLIPVVHENHPFYGQTASEEYVLHGKACFYG